jgi:hypothetical protein
MFHSLHQKQMYGDRKMFKNIISSAHCEVDGDSYKMYCIEKLLASMSAQSVIAVDGGSDRGKRVECC